jgi:hypothetical protein
MELRLTFAAGTMTGEGRDPVAQFVIDGTYDPASGECRFTKTYPGRHAVRYAGFNEGKGIWGTWTLESEKGGFHIWHEGMADPTQQTLSEEADIPTDAPPPKKKRKLQPA